MRAVIWTDVFQCAAMVGGMLTILIKVRHLCFMSAFDNSAIYFSCLLQEIKLGIFILSRRFERAVVKVKFFMFM